MLKLILYTHILVYKFCQETGCRGILISIKSGLHNTMISGLSVFFVVIFFSSVIAKEQIYDINFERISIEQGLSQVSVFTSMIDSRGFVWFGTEQGLNRYDGYEFKVFLENFDEDTNSL